MAVYIGTSGWSYPHWNGVLYPEGLAPQGRLDVRLHNDGRGHAVRNALRLRELVGA